MPQLNPTDALRLADYLREIAHMCARADAVLPAEDHAATAPIAAEAGALAGKYEIPRDWWASGEG